MEIVRNLSKKEKAQLAEQEATLDQARIEIAQREFDTFNSVLVAKKYKISLNKEISRYLMGPFLQNVKFKGYESYAVKEIYQNLNDLRIESKPDSELELYDFVISGEIRPDVIEALFYFIKNYEGKGYTEACLFKDLADSFATPMQQINEDRQKLRDLSLELVAAEQGVEVEKIKEQYQNQNQNQNQ